MLEKHLKKDHDGHAEIVPQWVEEGGVGRFTDDQQSCLKKLQDRMKSGLTKEAYEAERAAFTSNTHVVQTARPTDRNHAVRWTEPPLQPGLVRHGLVAINGQSHDQVVDNWELEYLPEWLLNNESANVSHWDPRAYGE